MISLPVLEKDRIIDYCGYNMYHLGIELLKTRPFFVYYKEWTMLKALCEGSDSPSYAVRILFDEKGIANSCCTCYTNRVVPCKHIAALLLLWHQNPKGVPERSEWAQKLQSKKKEDVVALLEKVIDLYPENESCNLWLVQS
jgi:hypothetical protein